jgi:hypothetical protein
MISGVLVYPKKTVPSGILEENTRKKKKKDKLDKGITDFLYVTKKKYDTI